MNLFRQINESSQCATRGCKDKSVSSAVVLFFDCWISTLFQCQVNNVNTSIAVSEQAIFMLKYVYMAFYLKKR